jgi:tetratricopeptide (TPR) repeat protein
MCYSELLDILCEYDEARAEIDFAIELDPVYFMYQALSSIYYARTGRYDEALAATSRVYELNPYYKTNDWAIFNFYIHMGENSRAIEVLQKCLAGDTSTVNYANDVKEVYEKSGMKGALSSLIEVWQKKVTPSPGDIAYLYSILKEKQSTLNWLEKAMEDREPAVVRINTAPEYDFLRKEPRFLAMIEQMGLTSYNKRAPK